MNMASRRGAWLALLLLPLLALAVVMVPVMLIRPFAPQSPFSIALAYTLRRWSPWLTVAVALAALALAVRLWREAPRLIPRIAAVLLGLVAVATTWMARQNHFEWMFAPLPDARFARAADAAAVAPDDMVLAVTTGGDAVAYPVRQIAYHHLVEDSVGGVPIVATY
jgi:hypothetical protein